MRGLHKRAFQSALELDQIVGCCLRATQYPPLNVLQEKVFLEVQNKVFLVELGTLEGFKEYERRMVIRRLITIMTLTFWTG